jgi:hypothetical protein
MFEDVDPNAVKVLPESPSLGAGRWAISSDPHGSHWRITGSIWRARVMVAG